MNEIKDNIIDRIKAGDIAMRPRWHFVFKTFLLLIGIVLAALIAVYLLSFVLFTLHTSGLLFAPQFGWHGLVLFVVSSPWLLISILGMFLLLLYVLVSKYSFSYQKPLVYSIVGVVLFVIAVSSFIQYIGIHNRIQSFSLQHNVPGFAPLYRGQVGSLPSGVVAGTITEVFEDRFIVTAAPGETVVVTINSQTRIAPKTAIKVGVNVLVFGKEENGNFLAFGIKNAGNRGMSHPPSERPWRGINSR